jgi:hypothetical protein
MSNLTITKFPAAGALNTTDEFLVMQGTTTTRKGTIAQLSSIISGSTSFSALTFSTLTTAVAATVPAGVDAIYTGGYAAVGDGGGALYKRSASMPAHAGRFQSTDGAWWEYFPDGDGRINLLAFGADRTGAATCTTAINNMIAYGAAKGINAYYAPRGIYLVNTTPSVFPSYSCLEGDGMGQTVFKPGMTDGTACIKFGSTTRALFFRASGFSIAASINDANFIAGTATAQNCIGLDTGNYVSASAQTRYELDNILIHGCAIGWNANGWGVVAHAIHIEECDLAFAGVLMNTASLNLHLENNRKSMTLVNSYGVTFINFWDESDVANTLTSTIDQCNGITFTAPYFECINTYPRTQPFITVGATTECDSFYITGGTMAGSSGIVTGVAPLLLDKVNTGFIGLNVAEGTQGYGVKTTSNTKNVDLRYVTNYYMLQDNSKGQGPCVNYFANPRFDAGLKGWGSLAATRATITLDTTITRRGLNSFKVSATAGQNFNYAMFQITGEPLAAIKGKTVRLGAWIWVPNITPYNEASRTAWPSCLLQSYNGSTTVASTTLSDTMVRNAWNYFHTTVTVQSDATYLAISIFANQDSGVAAGTEYLHVDEITLVEDVSNLYEQMQGNYINSDTLPSFDGKRMRAFGTVATFGSSTGEIYSVGDIIMNSAVAALGTPGYICTTGGAGGTAVWSNMPALV